QRMFFQQVVRLYDDERRGGFEPDAALDADDGVADMDIAADAIGLGDGLKILNGRDGMREGLPVYGPELAVLKFQRDIAGIRARYLRRPCVFGKIVFGGECFLTADGGAPETFIDTVFGFFGVDLYAVVFEKVDLLFAAEPEVADGSEDLHAGEHALEDHIETDLVITGARTSVCDILCADLLYVVGHGDRLYHSFGADAQGIGSVLEDISEDEVFNTTVIIFPRNVDAFERGDAETFCPGFYLADLFLAESAGIDGEGMDLQMFYLIEPDGAVGGVQSAAVG